ncbi:PREDICTED: uncharacterized protein LOC106147898 [Chinchilla lanigera]|uniref:uncharacterized protein LOC106147898 n=1 Tax=Chinchilla lanigera TaxID=34839 RepID=UPI0006984016|nr:PREDICTED: uncharacterized protein LOC106147898 [Chinchilla lanigera]
MGGDQGSGIPAWSPRCAEVPTLCLAEEPLGRLLRPGSRKTLSGVPDQPDREGRALSAVGQQSPPERPATVLRGPERSERRIRASSPELKPARRPRRGRRIPKSRGGRATTALCVAASGAGAREWPRGPGRRLSLLPSQRSAAGEPAVLALAGRVRPPLRSAGSCVQHGSPPGQGWRRRPSGCPSHEQDPALAVISAASSSVVPVGSVRFLPATKCKTCQRLWIPGSSECRCHGLRLAVPPKPRALTDRVSCPQSGQQSSRCRNESSRRQWRRGADPCSWISVAGLVVHASVYLTIRILPDGRFWCHCHGCKPQACFEMMNS